MLQPTEDEIRTLAYELWVAAGRPEGRQQEFWIEAERQLSQNPLPASIDPRLHD